VILNGVVGTKPPMNSVLVNLDIVMLYLDGLLSLFHAMMVTAAPTIFAILPVKMYANTLKLNAMIITLVPLIPVFQDLDALGTNGLNVKVVMLVIYLTVILSKVVVLPTILLISVISYLNYLEELA
jgi:hypothetical protein